ncbi:MAG TPA: anion permease [Acidobacteriota bacterium]
MTTVILVFLIGLTIAYANGANDVAKGIATLVGSGMTNSRRAIAWGTFWTGIGGLAGAFFAGAMVKTFGKGLLAPGVRPTVATAVAVICGAAFWIGIATRRGLPVSTTHAIVGSVVGVALLAFGPAGMNWSSLTAKIVLPLLLSPAVALLLTAIALRAANAIAPSTDCVCVRTAQPILATTATLTAAMPVVHLSTCEANKEAAARGITFNHLHWLTSAAASFSRGLNDAPKMVALVLGAVAVSGFSAVPPVLAFAVVTTGILGGSWLAGRRVTDVLAFKVTRMDHREGLIANLITATLVGPGAAFGWPMSTTHVASGAIFGLSAGAHKANWSLVGEMVLAWMVTLPGAAMLAAATLLLLHAAGFQ